MERLDEKLRLLKPVMPINQWEALRLRYLLEKDFRKRAETEQMIDFLIAQKVPGLLSDHILLPPEAPDRLSGEYQIGNVIYPDRPIGAFGIRKGEWIRHCGIFGKTGSGKTTLAFRILRELCRKKNPFLIFDYKRNYRDILKHPDFENEEILIFTVGRNQIVPFYFNPKVPPAGTEEYVWIKQLSQIIEKVYLLGPGANDVFMESAGLSTFKEMHDRVLKQRKKARELLWWASVKRTLNAINYPGLGEMVNCKTGYSIPELLNKKVILELDGLSNSDQAFVIGCFLLWIYHYRMRQPEREVLKHFLIIEEAHHLFLKNRLEEDITDIIMREIRELGEAIILIDQHPSKISTSALGNLATKFALALSLNQDVSAIANAMLLDPNQKRYLGMLQVGQCVCRSDRLTAPLFLSISNFTVKKGVVTDQDLIQMMKPYTAQLKTENPAPANPSHIHPIPNPETLSPLGRLVLSHIATKPLLGVVKRFKELGLKTSHGYKILEELTGLFLIIDRTIDGRKFFDLTIAGRKALGKRAPLPGRGGLEHRYYVEVLQDHFLSKGAATHLEKDDIDLTADVDGKRIAVQVETGKSDLQGNLTKLGRFVADHKFMIAANRETEIRIKALLREMLIPDRASIRVLFAKDFLKHPPDLS